MTAIRRRRVALILSLATIGGVFAYLLYGGIGANVVYFLTPSELLAKGDSAVGAPVRLGGTVAPGSVVWEPDSLGLRFRLTDGARQIDVQSSGAPPQMFRPGIDVVVEGRFQRDGSFRSTNLMVRHSNEYHPPTPGETPREMYRGLIREGTT